MRLILLILFAFSPLFCFSDGPKPDEDIIWQAEHYAVLPEIPLAQSINKAKSLVINDYADCEPGRLKWYYEISDFKRALGLCGFDNVRLKFDRAYRDSGLAATASYYFTITDTEVMFDSLIAALTTPKTNASQDSFKITIANRKIFIPRKLLLADIVERQFREKRRVQEYEAYAKIIHDSFLSQLVLKHTQSRSRYCFTFRISNQAYSITGGLEEAGKEAELVKHEEKLEALENHSVVGAYAIGYRNEYLARNTASGIHDPFLQKKQQYAPVLLTDYSLKYDGKAYGDNSRLKLFEINVTAKSMEGLRQIGIKVNGIWNFKDVDGSTLATHSMQVPPESCVEFEAKAVDIYGEVISEKNPRYVRDLEDNRSHVFDSLWRSCDKAGEERQVSSEYLKKMEKQKRVNKAKRVANNVVKLLPLLLFF